MKPGLKSFVFNSYLLRVVMLDGEGWYLAQDVAQILDYDQTSNMTKRLDSDEKRNCAIMLDGVNYTNQTFINQSGLYEALFGSKKEEAKKFKHWLKREVLPEIQRTGSYTGSNNNFAVDLVTNEFLTENLRADHQKYNSNIINAVNVYSAARSVVKKEGDQPDWGKGRINAINYNRRNCVAVTERTPREWREQGVRNGYPRRITHSAKQVARLDQPEMACARSIADQLIRNGVSEEVAFEVGRLWVEPTRVLLSTGVDFNNLL